MQFVRSSIWLKINRYNKFERKIIFIFNKKTLHFLLYSRLLVLIITNKFDTHTDLIIKRFNELKFVDYVRFNTEDFPLHTRITYDSLNREIIIKRRDKKQISSREIKVIWYRRPEITTFTNLKGDGLKIARGEVRAFINWLYFSLEEKAWVSHIPNIRRAENKIGQINLAKQLGISVPATIISNSLSEIRQFYYNHNMKVVIKPLEQITRKNLSKENQLVYTNMLTEENLRNLTQGQLSLAPVFLQQYIDKVTEIRVTIIGEKVFATEIFSQEIPNTLIDWRKSAYLEIKPIHKSIELPKKISLLLLKIKKHYSLDFATFDLIKTNNDFVFLEINPNGQFAFIELLTKQPLTLTMAEFLINKNKYL